MLAFGAERLVGVIDGLVDLFDKLLADTNARARRRLGEYQQSVAGAANDKVRLLAVIARVLLDPDLYDRSRLSTLFTRVPKDRPALRWPTASGSPGRPTIPTSTSSVTTTPGCASASPASSRR